MVAGLTRDITLEVVKLSFDSVAEIAEEMSIILKSSTFTK